MECPFNLRLYPDMASLAMLNVVLQAGLISLPWPLADPYFSVAGTRFVSHAITRAY
ncbi:hypothetical protein BJX96DRAFT_143317 [Aspergillus floccosus]